MTVQELIARKSRLERELCIAANRLVEDFTMETGVSTGISVRLIDVTAGGAFTTVVGEVHVEIVI